jgi:hypothetical protein
VVYASLVIADTGSADLGLWHWDCPGTATTGAQSCLQHFWRSAAITVPCRTAQLPLEKERGDRPGGIAHHHEFKVVNLTSETIRFKGAQRREASRRTAWTAASCAAEAAALVGVSCKACA